jgi:hypothetical protein
MYSLKRYGVLQGLKNITGTLVRLNQALLLTRLEHYYCSSLLSACMFNVAFQSLLSIFGHPPFSAVVRLCGHIPTYATSDFLENSSYKC